MKKLLGLGLVLGCMFAANASNAETYYTIKDVNKAIGPNTQSVINYRNISQQYVNGIGIRLLNANKIDRHIVFGISTPLNYTIWGIKDDVTDSKRYLYQNRKVFISVELLNQATNDDEVAALVAHEIAHCLQSYTGKLRGSFHALVYTFTAKKQNYNADIAAIDMLAKAGFNPVGLVTILDKTAGQYRFDIGENALTTKRIRNAIQYIDANYPEYFKPYMQNPYFQNALLIIQPEEIDHNFKYYINKVKNVKIKK
ncbi:MAG: M48 family metalloprotease [Candidatus Gastranaerophilales bacterium]|nr:M48 family metalloprotease [Candidatus Gastranaerophilales bacterium]